MFTFNFDRSLSCSIYHVNQGGLVNAAAQSSHDSRRGHIASADPCITIASCPNNAHLVRAPPHTCDVIDQQTRWLPFRETSPTGSLHLLLSILRSMEEKRYSLEITLSLSDGDLMIIMGIVSVTALTVYHWGRCGRSHYSTPLVGGWEEDW